MPYLCSRNMYRRFSHIITMMLAGYLAIVACDPNIKHYCSKECEAHKECCHHHHHTWHCGVEISEPCHCGVTHIVAPEANAPVHHALVPDVLYCHTVGTTAISIEPLHVTSCHKSFHTNHAPPINSGGRDIITHKSVLII